jgi:GNAT superfamily N-acetyltransferase
MALQDVPGMAVIRGQLFPWMTASIAAQENWFRSVTPAAQPMRLIAEVDGEVAGFGTAMRFTASSENAGMANVCVLPSRQGHGIGSALWEQVCQHLTSLGVERAQGYGIDGQQVEEWMAKRGVRRGASNRYSMVDPRVLPEPPATPEGVTLVAASTAGPDAIFNVESVAAADVPGDIRIDSVSKEEWLSRLWNGPDYNREASTVAFVNGVPAALTNLEVNLATGRAWTAGTATLREFRGLGLAKLVKSVSLRKAAELGVTAAYTSNDYTNAPMLAVNDWLGYQATGTAWAYLKDFSPAP